MEKSTLKASCFSIYGAESGRFSSMPPAMILRKYIDPLMAVREYKGLPPIVVKLSGNNVKESSGVALSSITSLRVSDHKVIDV